MTHCFFLVHDRHLDEKVEDERKKRESLEKKLEKIKEKYDHVVTENQHLHEQVRKANCNSRYIQELYHKLFMLLF